MSPLTLTYFVDHDEGFEVVFSASLLNIPFYSTLLYLRLKNLSGHDHDIHQYYVPIVESLEIEIKIIVLGKRIRKLGSRRIVRIRIINGIIERKEIRYI